MPTRRLILMRHAKSSWRSGAPTDHERPLNGRGRRDAPKVGAELSRLGWVPERVLSSDSSRTRETFARMSASLGFEGEVNFLPVLYHAGIDELREVASRLPEAETTTLILGHNPGWEEALTWLSGHHEPMKTGCAALLSREAASWPEALADERTWSLAAVIHPRDL